MAAKKESAAAVTVQRHHEPLPVTSIADIGSVGSAIAQSGMFGSCTPGRGAVIAAICHQEGMSLLEFKRSYHVTDTGNVTMRADRMLAEFRRLGGTFEWIKYDETVASAKVSFRENKNLEIRYTFEEAREAGYVRQGSGWVKDPGAQLRARLITRAVRMICPEAVAGCYTPDEVADFESAPAGSSNQPAGDLDPVTVATVVQAVVSPAPVPATAGAAMPTPFTNVTPAPAPEPQAVPLNQADPSICPVPGGEMAGKPWAEMPDELLDAAMNLQNPEMTDAHRAHIAAIVTARKTQA